VRQFARDLRPHGGVAEIGWHSPMEREPAASDENIEIARRGLEHLHESHERGDATDRLLAICAPEIRVDATRRVFNPAI